MCGALTGGVLKLPVPTADTLNLVETGDLMNVGLYTTAHERNFHAVMSHDSITHGRSVEHGNNWHVYANNTNLYAVFSSRLDAALDC